MILAQLLLAGSLFGPFHSAPEPSPTPRSDVLVADKAWQAAREQCAKLAATEPLICQAGCAAFADVCPRKEPSR